MVVHIGLGIGLSFMPGAGPSGLASAPVNVTPPAITGVLTQGQTLTATVGGWTGSPTSFAYQWKRSGANIGGATGSTYVAQAADVSAGAGALTVTVTATNDIGSTPATSAGVTIAAPLSLTGTPGGATVGVAYSFTPSSAGGHTPKTYALTGTLPSGLSFNTSTGAITGTPVSSGTASGLNITVTDADGLTASLGVFSIVVTAASLDGPYREDFTGAAGTLLSTMSVGGLAWTYRAGSSGVANPLKLTGTGELYGANNSGNGAFTATDIEVGVTDEAWIQYRASSVATSLTGLLQGAFRFEDSYIGDGSTNVWDYLALYSSSASTGLRQIRMGSVQSGAGNAAPTSRQAASNIWQEVAGDVFEARKRKVGAAIYYDMYYNGELILTGTYDFAGLGLTLNGRYGVGGALANSTARALDSFEVGDPTQHAMLRIIRPTHVAHQASDGSVPLWLQAKYSLAAPTSVLVYIRNAATGAIVTGYDGVPLEGLTDDAANDKISGTLTIASGDCPATFQIGLQRGDITGGDGPIDWSCVQRPGIVILTFGQSLNTEADHKGPSGATASVQGWIIDGAYGPLAPSSDVERRVQKGPTDRAVSAFMERLAAQSGLSEQQIAVVRCGNGGTTFHERHIGTNGWTALLEGLRRAGNRITAMYRTEFEYEVTNNNANLSTPTSLSELNSVIRPLLDDQIDAIEAICGYSIPVILDPVGAVRSSTASVLINGEVCRKFAWDLATNYDPTRYKLGSYRMDMQGLTSDPYHNTDAGYLKQRKRGAWTVGVLLGYGSEHRRGPKITGITKDSDTQVTVTLDLQGATSLEITNQAYASDYRGGLTFATNSDFADGNQVAPTNASIGTPSGGSCTVTYTFGAGTFTGLTAYVRGPWGACPFSRNGASSTTWNDTTVNNAIDTNASMLQGVYSNGDKVPVQPTFGAGVSAADYLEDA